ncbi:hypothetical protein LINPERHAP2_LOCUS19568 [Linum perenne]
MMLNSCCSPAIFCNIDGPLTMNYYSLSLGRNAPSKKPLGKYMTSFTINSLIFALRTSRFSQGGVMIRR